MRRFFAANLELHPLTGDLFDEALRLWESSDGIVLRAEDRDVTAFAGFLARNPRLSWGVLDGGRLVGAVMAGHDGRRGHIYHLAVAADRVRLGIGRILVARVRQELALHGIHKVHAQVMRNNLQGQMFWRKLNWAEREELVQFSHETRGT